MNFNETVNKMAKIFFTATCKTNSFEQVSRTLKKPYGVCICKLILLPNSVN